MYISLLLLRMYKLSGLFNVAGQIHLKILIRDKVLRIPSKLKAATLILLLTDDWITEVRCVQTVVTNHHHLLV